MKGSTPERPDEAFFSSRRFEWYSGPYRALRHTFTLRVEAAAEFRPRLEGSLSPMADDTVGTSDHVYSIVDRGEPMSGRYAVYDNHRRVAATASRFVAAGTIHWLANQGAITTADPAMVQLHAGGVQRHDATVILPADMDAGKSTTVAGLLRAGYRYLSDEVVEIAPDLCVPTSYPKALALDRGSLEVLGIVSEPFSGAAAEPQWHLTAARLGSAEPAVVPALVRLIIFPRYTPGIETAMERVSPAQSLEALSQSTFKFKDRAAKALPVLADLAHHIPAFRLQISDLDEAVRLLDECMSCLAE